MYNKKCENKNKHCPLLMAEGRAFTDYHSRYMNDNTSLDHRQFLMNHANDLMNRDRYKWFSNNKYIEPFDQGTNDGNIVSCNRKACCSECSEKIKDGNGSETRIYNVITSDVAKMVN